MLKKYREVVIAFVLIVLLAVGYLGFKACSGNNQMFFPDGSVATPK